MKSVLCLFIWTYCVYIVMSSGPVLLCHKNTSMWTVFHAVVITQKYRNVLWEMYPSGTMIMTIPGNESWDFWSLVICYYFHSVHFNLYTFNISNDHLLIFLQHCAMVQFFCFHYWCILWYFIYSYVVCHFIWVIIFYGAGFFLNK